MLPIFGLGLLLGMQHATDADHLAAVATLATGEYPLARALQLGAVWGLGHTLVLLVVAAVVAGLGWGIPSQWAIRFEQAVGVMLVALGARLAWRLSTGLGPGGLREPPLRGAELPGHRLPAGSMLVGMVHGLAGSAALILLAAGALPTPAAQLAYIAVLGVGSIAGMALLTGALSLALQLTARRLTALRHGFGVLVACASIAIGLHLLASPAS